ncbi:TolC family protein [Sulfitobacter sp. D35]|uniref:TolC family protein n=1 Tax=Sulfitobacter sp. D35 TaxID=3083252 RepID=UPI00296EE10C|nr:TolC family protein [Sulfitobacter sp. D35]MDW4496603.1 TolC family protein [Sulfitobacter sp. D35]
MTATRQWCKALALVSSALAISQHAAAEPIGDAVRHALTTNPSIRASQSEMRASAYELMELRGEYLPTVRVFGEAGYQRIDDLENLSPDENDDTIDTQQIGASARLVLFDGFRRANLVYANAARVDGSIFRLLDASETMALNATETYIDVVRHQTLVGVARRNIARHREIGAQVRDLVQGGRLPFSDELTIDDRITSAQLALQDVERALRDATVRYERIVGRRPSAPMSLQRASVPGSEQALKQTAVRNSYRVKFAQSQVNQSRHNQEVELSDRLPQVALRAGISRDLNRSGGPGQRTDRSVGLGFEWKLYQGGRKAQKNALAERTGKALSEREVAVRDVHEMAGRAWNNYVSGLERQATLTRQLAIDRTIVDVYGEEFLAAKRSLLDLLEVERARFSTEFQKVSADASVAFSSYRVLAAQSTLAQHFGVKPSDMALEPNFEDRALVSPSRVFNTTIEPLQ